jgi:hypothetical protein
VYWQRQEVHMHDNPFAEFDEQRRDPPGSVPGTGIGRQVGSVPAQGGPAGRGWSFAYVGADRLFAGLLVLVVAVGLVIWLVKSLVG